MASFNRIMEEVRDVTGTAKDRLTRLQAHIKAAGEASFAPLPPKKIHENLRQETYDLIRQRGSLEQQGANTEDLKILTKQIRNSRRQEKRRSQLEATRHDLDLRDRWLGIRQLKSDFKPAPYSLKDQDGKVVPKYKRAETAAKYLAEKHWCNPDATNGAHIPAHQIWPPNPKLEQGEVTLEDVHRAVKKLKRRKASGPDEIPTEFFLALHADNMRELATIFSSWITTGEPISEILARVILIFKKGDATLPENHRPISLLNTVYKIFAKIIHFRVSEAVGDKIQQMQFGFRTKRSTQYAVHLVRRLMDIGEATQLPVALVLLGWEKAFDKIEHGALFKALQRMGITGNVFAAIKKIYASPKFFVDIEGTLSDQYRQSTGIRQGCPLSPTYSLSQ